MQLLISSFCDFFMLLFNYLDTLPKLYYFKSELHKTIDHAGTLYRGRWFACTDRTNMSMVLEIDKLYGCHSRWITFDGCIVIAPSNYRHRQPTKHFSADYMHINVINTQEKKEKRSYFQITPISVSRIDRPILYTDKLLTFF